MHSNVTVINQFLKILLQSKNNQSHILRNLKWRKKLFASIFAKDCTSFTIHKDHTRQVLFLPLYKETQDKSNNFSGTKETVYGRVTV